MLDSLRLNPVAMVRFWSFGRKKNKEGRTAKRKGKKGGKKEGKKRHIQRSSFYQKWIVSHLEEREQRGKEKEGETTLSGSVVFLVLHTLPSVPLIPGVLNSTLSKTRSNKSNPCPYQSKILFVLDWPVLRPVAMTLLLIYSFLPETAHEVIKRGRILYFFVIPYCCHL